MSVSGEQTARMLLNGLDCEIDKLFNEMDGAAHAGAPAINNIQTARIGPSILPVIVFMTNPPPLFLSSTPFPIRDTKPWYGISVDRFPLRS
jgi:hypothetical protein